MSKFSIVLLSACLLSACDFGGGVEIPPSNTAPNNFSEAAGRIEAQRGAPVLDRGASLAGADRNANGMRDDIEAYIDGLPDTGPQKEALRQTATAFSAALSTNVDDKAELSANSAKLSNASWCLFSRYPSSLANKRAREMEKFHVNTKHRFDAYDAYNRALDGSTSTSPMGDGCLK